MRALHLEANLERLIRMPNARDDKYSRGVVGFVTGSNDFPGAALLGVGAALNSSIGMVRYVGEQRVQDLLMAAHPEVVCRARTGEAGRANAWVLGSGVAITDEVQASNLRQVFERATEPVIAVIDAGALELLDFDQLRQHRLLLTPHAGELARLLNRLEANDSSSDSAHTADSVAEGSFLFASQAAKLTGQTVLLKGNRTVLIKPTGEGRVVGPNSAHLATAGSGDILAGILGAIAAANSADKKFEWLDIAELATKIHSAAADLAAETTTVNASAILQAVGEINGRLIR